MWGAEVGAFSVWAFPFWGRFLALGCAWERGVRRSLAGGLQWVGVLEWGVGRLGLFRKGELGSRLRRVGQVASRRRAEKPACSK